MARYNNLPSQRETEAVARKIRGAFRAIFHRRGRTFFEHGHWWVEDDDGHMYDAVDAVGGRAVNGFDFERVG